MYNVDNIPCSRRTEQDYSIMVKATGKPHKHSLKN